MTDYEMRKIAKMQADFLIQTMKQDDELLDLIFPSKMLDVSEAAAYLHVSVERLYHIVEDIPHTKVGRKLLFSERALMRWVQRGGRMRSVMVVQMEPEVERLKAM